MERQPQGHCTLLGCNWCVTISTDVGRGGTPACKPLHARACVEDGDGRGAPSRCLHISTSTLDIYRIAQVASRRLHAASSRHPLQRACLRHNAGSRRPRGPREAMPTAPAGQQAVQQAGQRQQQAPSGRQGVWRQGRPGKRGERRWMAAPGQPGCAATTAAAAGRRLVPPASCRTSAGMPCRCHAFGMLPSCSS